MDIEFVAQGDSAMRRIDRFLNTHALKYGDCLPPPLLDIFAIVTDGQDIQACCGASLAIDGSMHLESIYDIDSATLALISARQSVCEIGRWFSINPNATVVALRGLVDHLLGRGITTAICELRPATVRRAAGIGLPLQETSSCLLLDRIDPAEIAYYEQNPPRLYVLDLTKIRWK